MFTGIMKGQWYSQFFPLYYSGDCFRRCCEGIQLKSENMASELEVTAPSGVSSDDIFMDKCLSMEINILRRVRETPNNGRPDCNSIFSTVAGFVC